MGKRIAAKITGVAGYVPPRVVTNFDLEKIVDTTDEWIRARTGIRERRLADEGTSYNDLVDEVRQELARRWVKEAARPLGEVAFLLGYSELSAFLRAFKRWTGKPAGDFRVASTVMRSGARGHRAPRKKRVGR